MKDIQKDVNKLSNRIVWIVQATYRIWFRYNSLKTSYFIPTHTIYYCKLVSIDIRREISIYIYVPLQARIIMIIIHHLVSSIELLNGTLIKLLYVLPFIFIFTRFGGVNVFPARHVLGVSQIGRNYMVHGRLDHLPTLIYQFRPFLRRWGV